MDGHASIDEQLAAVPLFEGLSKKQLRRISGLMTRIDRPAGQVVTTEGEPGAEFFIVREGEVEVRRADRLLRGHTCESSCGPTRRRLLAASIRRLGGFVSTLEQDRLSRPAEPRRWR